jgi:hypothetical protein
MDGSGGGRRGVFVLIGVLSEFINLKPRLDFDFYSSRFLIFILRLSAYVWQYFFLFLKSRLLKLFFPKCCNVDSFTCASLKFTPFASQSIFCLLSSNFADTQIDLNLLPVKFKLC